MKNIWRNGMDGLAYLGPRGTFTHDAALVYGRGAFNLVEFDSIQEIIHAVSKGEVPKGLVPVENAIEGTVNLTIDMLVHEVDLYIIGELILPISHCLMARSGTSIKSIRKVFSHPQGLAQSRKFLEKHLRGIELENTESTAAAAQKVKKCQKPWAAIANARAADIYGLEILARDIQDNPSNSTRFIVISKEKAQNSVEDKTSLAFTVEHKPGSLLRALGIFADYGLNLTKIESRPMRTHLGEYLFLVDFEGHKEDVRVKNALLKLQGECNFYKFLGSYPKFSEFR